jgi:hypothetical protein
VIERWVTGSGFTGAALLGVLAIAAYLVLSRSPKARLAVPAAAALLAGAAVVLLVGRLVVTPRESLKAAAVALVDAAATADQAALRPLLHPDARVRTRFAAAQGRDRVAALAGQAEPFITDHRVREIRVDLRGPRVARTQIRLSVQGDRIPPASWWAVDWQRPGPDDPWVVTSIEPIWIQGMADPAGPASAAPPAPAGP